MEMKRGDLEPDLVITVEDASGVANLNQVTSWRVIGKQHGAVVVDGAPTSVTVDPGNESKATLARAWETGETADVGDMQIEVEAMWPGGRPQTFPASGYGVVRIRADLG
ncbi:hypothetical protein [Amycolatopsis sp. WAC 04182]|uniref:hypothetical protein n=1 Tax=Amycolatopsis sp. WAC 04182 TaxID=2203198 RepID=UPI000F78B46C|nr:hypothetical protein [Amycolatopsis sp. WAC 04182]